MAKYVITGFEVITLSNVGKSPVICKLCGKEAMRTSNRQVVCAECKPSYRVIKNREQCNRYRSEHFVPKGYNQAGTNNNAWKNGSGWYKTIAKEIGHCEICSSKEFLVVHHKDRNRENNARTNLIVMCRSCHAKEHSLADNINKHILKV